MTSLALAVRLALGPVPRVSGDEVAAVVEEMPVGRAGNRGRRRRRRGLDHLRS